MANMAWVTLKVKGPEPSVRNFVKMFTDFGFSLYLLEFEIQEGKMIRKYELSCKWSIKSGILNVIPGFEKFIRKNKLCLEMFSEENGLEFQEHYLYKDGELHVSECLDWCEYDISDFRTKDEAEAEIGVSITDSEWEGRNETNCISRGGIENYCEFSF